MENKNNALRVAGMLKGLKTKETRIDSFADLRGIGLIAFEVAMGTLILCSILKLACKFHSFMWWVWAILATIGKWTAIVLLPILVFGWFYLKIGSLVNFLRAPGSALIWQSTNRKNADIDIGDMSGFEDSKEPDDSSEESDSISDEESDTGGSKEESNEDEDFDFVFDEDESDEADAYEDAFIEMISNSYENKSKSNTDDSCSGAELGDMSGFK